MNIVEHASPTPVAAPLSLLIVDDDANVLAGFRRSIGRKWNLVTAQGGVAAIALVKEKGPISVYLRRVCSRLGAYPCHAWTH